MTYNTIIDSFSKLYVYNFKETKTTKGIVENFYKYVDYNGTVEYRYSVKYFVGNKTYNLNESLSPDSLINVVKYDSVDLRYVSSYPSEATIKSKSDLLTKGMTSFIILFIELVLIGKSVVVIRSIVKKERLSDDFWGTD
ncbi:hypothetical protein [Lacibacter cauensis]|uniref:hypothetical protein n=1 Tax=Lacibacter cauensis TaxID=510947 RepID=UPI0011A7467D|nr:hypothetical protein [Lacibacter cauensis]